MQQVSLPNMPFRVRPAVLIAAAAIIVLHAAAWLLRDRIIDGWTIVIILSTISATNLGLYLLLRIKFPQFARIILQSVYIFHILFFLLAFVELRKF